MMRKEIQIDREEKYNGIIINVTVDSVKIEGTDTIAKREVAWHPGAVCVLFTKDEKILLVEQYRYALGKATWEIPAGKLDPNETPRQAAIRELAEETQFLSQDIELIYEFYSAPGFSNEKLYLYGTTSAVKTDQYMPDEDEYVHVRWFDKKQVAMMLKDGVFDDAKTIIAIQHWIANGK